MTSINYEEGLRLWGVMGFNATFNNISVISCQSLLLMEETGEITDLSQVTDTPYHTMLYQVHLVMNWIPNHNVS